MAKLRYVLDTAAAPDADKSAEFPANVSGFRAIYETEPEIHAALLPRPLVPCERPEIFAQFSRVQLFLSESRTVEIGAATIGVSCYYGEKPGFYVLAMAMEDPFVVMSGREIYGEPKKVATTRFELDENDYLRASVCRHDVDFLEMRGSLGASLGPRQPVEHMFCIKAMPGIRRDGGFDGEVLLTELEWRRKFTDVREVNDPEIILRESKFDPLIDVPVKKIKEMLYTEGGTINSGKILRAIPGEWYAPFMNQRYDDPVSHPLELSLASGGQ
ncbi:acetoacetate decarboxylase family protein [Haliea sp.]|uniref:acetoacetate decarboxylase family protein n=1 Tax=Haliea sp. TaxID=1932666 RepID=UPI00257D8C42|nr:acetoacetate decarboxylase family protein [Haliea sp.]